jgi:hypothetical protein
MPPPVKKKRSGPVKLARGEVAGVRLSGPERSLLQFSQDRFGEHLTRLLLSGLGEKRTELHRLFIISFASGDGVLLRRRLRVEADDLTPETLTSLPYGRDPLALLALLRLLTRAGGKTPASLFYERKEVLSLLGWDDSAETRLAVDEAVDRYSCLSYRWALSRMEEEASKLTFHRSRERFISGYGLLDSEEEGGRTERVSNRVDFSAAFIEGLERRMLFDVIWDNVRVLRVIKRRRTAGRSAR